MQIESIIKRAGGSRIDIGGTEYHFKPAKDGEAHVCEVTNREHAARFLEIKEGYRVFNTDNAPAKQASGSEDEEPNPMVIKNAAGQEVDLAVLKKADLIDFAEKEGFTVDATAKVHDIRLSIVAQVKAEA